MIVHSSFKRIRDQIGIRIGRTTYKFCNHCGYRLRGERDYLINHYKSFHEGHNHEWLKYGEIPKNNWYTNLTDHFENPKVEL